jgi:hypothetical protein
MRATDERDTAARVAGWVAARTPEPPVTLAGRVGALYARGTVPDPEAPTAAGCVSAAARAVGALIADGATSRRTALDLLAADALATYAFELASERPESLAMLADEAMRRFAALAVPPSGGDVAG